LDTWTGCLRPGPYQLLKNMTRTLLWLGLGLVAVASGCNGGGRETSTGAIEVGSCHVGGCSGELCSDVEGQVSPCVARPEFACYGSSSAICEPQQNGECGWSATPELLECLGTGRP